MKKIKETDLYQPIADYFSAAGYTVRSEVKDCDITATKGDELVVVELKSSFNATLLVQAARRQRTADAVYIAIPHPGRAVFSRRWKDICHLIRRLELGLIVVTFKDKPQMKLVFPPEPFDRERSRRQSRGHRKIILNELKERHGEYNVGGSTGRPVMTVYRELAVRIACCLERYGPLSPKQLCDYGTSPKTPSILQKNFYGWFDRVEHGVYDLNPAGKEMLAAYPELAEYYRKELAKGD